MRYIRALYYHILKIINNDDNKKRPCEKSSTKSYVMSSVFPSKEVMETAMKAISEKPE